MDGENLADEESARRRKEDEYVKRMPSSWEGVLGVGWVVRRTLELLDYVSKNIVVQIKIERVEC